MLHFTQRVRRSAALALVGFLQIQIARTSQGASGHDGVPGYSDLDEKGCLPGDIVTFLDAKFPELVLANRSNYFGPPSMDSSAVAKWVRVCNPDWEQSEVIEKQKRIRSKYTYTSQKTGLGYGLLFEDAFLWYYDDEYRLAKNDPIRMKKVLQELERLGFKQSSDDGTERAGTVTPEGTPGPRPPPTGTGRNPSSGQGGERLSPGQDCDDSSCFSWLNPSKWSKTVKAVVVAGVIACIGTLCWWCYPQETTQPWRTPERARRPSMLEVVSKDWFKPAAILTTGAAVAGAVCLKKKLSKPKATASGKEASCETQSSSSAVSKTSDDDNQFPTTLAVICTVGAVVGVLGLVSVIVFYSKEANAAQVLNALDHGAEILDMERV